MQVAFVVLALAAFVAAAPTDYSAKESYPSSNYEGSYAGNSYKDNYAPAEYNFAYKVEDEYSYVNFGQNEERKGDYTKGYYYVDLPDDRRQKVNYYVDGYSGYIVEVDYEDAKYSNEKKYSQNNYSAKPVYSIKQNTY